MALTRAARTLAGFVAASATARARVAAWDTLQLEARAAPNLVDRCRAGGGLEWWAAVP